MNFVSIAGSFGALVYVFQDGHLWVKEPRPLEPALAHPPLLRPLRAVDGLRGAHALPHEGGVPTARETTPASVAEGLEKTAGLITSAAAIMVAVFAAFALAHVILIEAVGFGMAIAVTLDATLVRILLVPATMRLFGDINWWAPHWLMRRRVRSTARSSARRHGLRALSSAGGLPSGQPLRPPRQSGSSPCRRRVRRSGARCCRRRPPRPRRHDRCKRLASPASRIGDAAGLRADEEDPGRDDRLSERSMMRTPRARASVHPSWPPSTRTTRGKRAGLAAHDGHAEDRAQGEAGVHHGAVHRRGHSSAREPRRA